MILIFSDARITADQSERMNFNLRTMMMLDIH